jgi:hypothetical protein
MSKPANLEERETAARLFEEWWAADVAYHTADTDVSDEDFAKLKIRAEKAQHDFQSQPLRPMFDDGIVDRCALTNVPLLVTDEVCFVLASAIGAESEEQGDGPMLPMFSEMEPA